MDLQPASAQSDGHGGNIDITIIFHKHSEITMKEILFTLSLISLSPSLGAMEKMEKNEKIEQLSPSEQFKLVKIALGSNQLTKEKNKEKRGGIGIQQEPKLPENGKTETLDMACLLKVIDTYIPKMELWEKATDETLLAEAGNYIDKMSTLVASSPSPTCLAKVLSAHEEETFRYGFLVCFLEEQRPTLFAKHTKKYYGKSELKRRELRGLLLEKLTKIAESNTQLQTTEQKNEE
ncbi:MAG: hypothetical protein M1549_00825 [Candidatus Dependentiae bacterium]|nr:hypothetical protein [Candidatus Dependentiae bacterium]